MSIRVAVWPSGTCITWRPMSWGEYRKIQSLQEPPAAKALEVYTLCRVEGPYPDKVMAGPMMWIFQYELENSPFSGSFQTLSLPLEQARAKLAGTYLLTAQAFISSVFKIPFEKMEEWDAETFLLRVAQAEFIAGVPLNPVDPKTIKSPKMGQGNKANPNKKQLTTTQQMALDRSIRSGK